MKTVNTIWFLFYGHEFTRLVLAADYNCKNYNGSFFVAVCG